MKKLYYLMLTTWMILCWSCSSGGDDLNTKPVSPPEEVTKIEISSSNPVIEEKGGTATVSFTTNAAWTASVSTSRASSWCSVSPTSGAAGSHTLTITTEANDTYDERNATVTLTAGKVSKSFVVKQKQKDALTASSAKNEFPFEGGELVIEVKANISFETEIDEDCKDWVTSSSSRALTTSTLKFKISENESSEKREGKVTVKSGEFKEEIKIYQEGSKPKIVLTQDEYTVGSEGEDIQIELKSNVEYTVEMPDVAWITESESRAMSTHTHYFSIAPNEDYDLRTAEIIFANKELNLSDTVRITQVQKDAIIVAKNEYSMDAAGGQLKFTVNSNVDFEVSTDVEWIKQDAASRALVETPLSFTVEANGDYSPREGVITLSDGSLTQEVRIIQKSSGPPFVVHQKEYIVPKVGSKIALRVSYNEPYMVVEKSNFIHFEEDMSLKTSTEDLLIFRAFSSETDREGFIILENEEKTYRDTIVVKQQHTDEELHFGQGNTDIGVRVITHCSGGTLGLKIYTNLDKYEVVLIPGEGSGEINHVSSEKTDYGFLENFYVSANTTETDQEYNVAFIGPNITFVHGIIVRPPLYIYIDEGKEKYISEDGETFTIHAWTKDDNLNIRMEGEDTSWLSVKDVDDTYIDGVRRINTTYVAEPNKTGKTRELYVVGFNGFNDNERIKIIQPSGEGVLLSKEKMIVGAWASKKIILVKDCEYIIEPDASASWLTVGTSEKKNGIIEQTLNVEAYTGDKERKGVLTLKSGSITHKLEVRQMPESGSLVDDSPEAWKSFDLPPVDVKNNYPNDNGSMLYFSIVENPENFIHIQSRKVLEQLYFTPEDKYVPKLTHLEYVLDRFDGVSYCGGGNGMKLIALSNQYVESYYNSHGAKALVAENRGVLTHELTHAFQLEPKGCGDYGSSKVFHSCIEGMADAVRTLCGGFTESDRPHGGHYLDSYRYTGFFIAWLVKNKDKDFLRKFNLSTQEINPWSFDAAIKHILGEKYDVEELWIEYLKAMGDIK